MPVMFVFHNTFDVAGAGPAEDREKDESPWNWGHSYWFKIPELETTLAFNCAFTEFLPVCKLRDIKIDERSTRTKIDTTLRFLIIGSSPESQFFDESELISCPEKRL